MENPTLSDVARAAGVSYATADRVINARGNVAEKSIRKVHEAMEALGYVRNIAAANLSRGRVYRLAFLLPQGSNAFFARIRDCLQALAGHLLVERVSVEVIDVAAFSVEALRDSLEAVTHHDFDGIAVVGLQGQALDAPLAVLREKGVAIVGLVSDLPQPHSAAYVGINNVAAGRTAARLIGMAHGGGVGCVQTIAGSLEAGDHVERLAGFREVMAKDFSQIQVMDPVMTKDTAEVVRAEAARALETNLDISAVYNVGAGNSGLGQTLRGLPEAREIFCVVHELVPHSRQALLDGVFDLVIDQRPEVEVNRACQILRALIDQRDPPPMPELVPTIYVRDNLPAELPDTLIRDHTS